MTPEQFSQIIDRLDTLIEKFNQPQTKKVYTIEEVATLFQISRSTILRAIKKNQLRPLRIGGWRITNDQLDEWMDSRRPVKIKRK